MSVFGLASNVRVRTKGFKGSAPNTPTLTMRKLIRIVKPETRRIDMDTIQEEKTYEALLEAEEQSQSTVTRHTHNEVMEAARNLLKKL